MHEKLASKQENWWANQVNCNGTTKIIIRNAEKIQKKKKKALSMQNM